MIWRTYGVIETGVMDAKLSGGSLKTLVEFPLSIYFVDSTR